MPCSMLSRTPVKVAVGAVLLAAASGATWWFLRRGGGKKKDDSDSKSNTTERTVNVEDAKEAGIDLNDLFEKAKQHATTLGQASVEQRLRLYALFKQATVGPCNGAQPSLIDMKARAKWDSWKRLGDMPTADAMLEYIREVTLLDPTWHRTYEAAARAAVSGKAKKSKGSGGGDGGGDGGGAGGGDGEDEEDDDDDDDDDDADDDADDDGGHGAKESKGNEPKVDVPPGDEFIVSSTVSTLAGYQRKDEDTKQDLFTFVRDENTAAVQRLIAEGVDVNQRFETGETALHAAAEASPALVKLLLDNGADPNVTEPEGGSTPLAYAILNDQFDAAQYLIEGGADPNVEEDGVKVLDLCPEIERARLMRVAALRNKAGK